VIAVNGSPRRTYAGLANELTCSMTLTISLRDPPEDTVEEIDRMALACVGLLDTDANWVRADPIKLPPVALEDRLLATVTSSTETVRTATTEFAADAASGLREVTLAIDVDTV